MICLLSSSPEKTGEKQSNLVPSKAFLDRQSFDRTSVLHQPRTEQEEDSIKRFNLKGFHRYEVVSPEKLGKIRRFTNAASDFSGTCTNDHLTWTQPAERITWNHTTQLCETNTLTDNLKGFFQKS